MEIFSAKRLVRGLRLVSSGFQARQFFQLCGLQMLASHCTGSSVLHCSTCLTTP